MFAGFFDLPECPDKTRAKAGGNHDEPKCLVAGGLDHEMSNANGTSERRKRAQKRLDQGTLMLGIGPVGRIDTLVGGCCAKAASAIKTAHDSAMNEPGSHRFSVRQSPGLSSRRARCCVHRSSPEYRYGERTRLPSTHAQYHAS
jgi:hypothetical protein